MAKHIVIGSDPWAGKLHAFVVKTLGSWSYSVESVNAAGGERVPYYEAAQRVALKVSGQADCVGIVLCGTGMGAAMMANKFPGISCALCETPLAAHRSRIFNNANVLAMGEFFTTETVAEEILKVFLETEFREGVDHERGEEIAQWHKTVKAIEGDLYREGWQERLR